ncbi:uncharacterized protein LOC143847974 [Tasmannia lanceolata]|uniref:uncharacterized protein LOC143847974 n=1 Tax=Tasmannia lanceolata TaxID=3420 RepID=UPI0040646249
MDPYTMNATRLTYARICVEVEASSNFPSYITLTTPSGVIKQMVEYDWKPSPCPKCNTFSHSPNSCPHSPQAKTIEPERKKQWRPVSKSAQSDPSIEPAIPHSSLESLNHLVCPTSHPICDTMVEDTAPLQSPQNGSPSADSEKPVLASLNAHTLPTHSNDENRNMEYYISKICDYWTYYANFDHTILGRIWVVWDPRVLNFLIHSDSCQHVHGEVHYIHSPIHYALTSIYAKNSGLERRNLWNSIRSLSSIINSPWIVFGDFNAVRFADERYGGAGLIQGDVDDFNSFIHDCSLAELRAMGHFFTWSNSSIRGIHKLRRLDKCLVNEDWLCTYPLSTATFKNSGLSDHSPIIIQIEGQEISKPKPFRFHNMWLEDASLFEVVERAWAVEIKGIPMFQFVKKLKEVKSRIKSWNYNVFGRIDVLLPMARQELNSIQSQIAANPTDPILRNAEAVIKEKVIRTANLEEALYRQKARINWLNS